MAVAEFNLIKQYFTRPPKNLSTRLGVGDDCAVLAVPSGYELAMTTDTMVENVHFFAGTDPESLGHKLLAVNLSDLASMGAKPVAFMLAVTLPHPDENWLANFAQGLLALAAYHQIDLIGGDTTQGPLTLTVQAMGLVPAGMALRRNSAKVGDYIYMTGELGNAGLGLKINQGYHCPESADALARFNRPCPQVGAGLALRALASACIDISDGLASDLGHILDQSQVGACIDWQALPLSKAVQAYIAGTGDWLMPLVAGDDYELCFTASPEKSVLLDNLAFPCTRIGVIEPALGLRINKAGDIQPLTVKGFEHFS